MTKRITSKQTIDDKGNWIDGQGNAIPTRYIDKPVKDRDRTVRRIYARAASLSERLQTVKGEVLNLVDTYLNQVAEEYGEKWKGNAELVTFDGRIKVEVKISEALEFDERLQVAKSKIDNCLRRWTTDARAEVQAIINRAFSVDSKGRINVRAVISLRQIKSRDPIWIDAMEIIADSLRIRNTRRYINVYERDGQDRWRLINLNWSAI